MKLSILWLSKIHKAEFALLTSHSHKGISFSEAVLLIPPLSKIQGWPKKLPS